MGTINLGDKPDDSAFDLNDGETYTAVIEEPRTWRERLFSWPWKPWQRTKATVGDYRVEEHDGLSHLHRINRGDG